MLRAIFVSIGASLAVFGASVSVKDFHEPLGSITTKKGELNFSVGIGSGGFHLASDPKNVFYAITDRGINIDCKDSQKILGEKFCEKGKIFPMPSFSPTIYKIEVTDDGYKILQKIPLKTRSKQITGISNPQTEISFGIDKNELVYDPDGIDAEAIVVTKNREFYIAEEYGPSILHVSKDGEALERFVPKGVAKTLEGSDVKLSEVLPQSLRQRQLNRGFEALALSPDESTLYTVLQSPIKGEENSKLVPFIAIDLKSKKIKGEYIYELDSWRNFTRDASKKEREQNDVKLSEMASLPNGDIIMLERISASTKFYKISPKEAKVGEPLKKTLVFDTDSMDKFPSKIESLIIVSPTSWYLINDNDFGIEGDKTKIIKLDLK